MLDLYITVDTELWPFSPGWPVNPLPADVSNFDAEFAVYFDGRTAGGDFGVPYQLALLARYGLKASYFVEPLFSLVAGPDYLQRMVACIESAGQEAQLHLHTEWLGEIRHPKLPAERRQHLRQYDLAEQTRIVEVASGLLQQAGAPFETIENALPFLKTPEKQAVLKKVDDALTAMRKDGTLTKISEKWFAADITSK